MMIKDLKTGDLVKVYGDRNGKIGVITNTITNTTTGTKTYAVLFPNGECKFIGVLWLTPYEEPKRT